MTEVWKAIPGYEGLYEVSDLGRVRTVKTGLIRSLVKASHGYPTVSLSKGGSARVHSVHALVMLTFVGPCPEGYEVLHGADDTKTNVRLENLSYGTRQDNLDDMKRKGRQSKGENRPLAKLTEAAVRDIRLLSATMSDRALATMFGVRHAAISDIMNGVTWEHVR